MTHNPNTGTAESYQYVDCDECQTNHADDEACSPADVLARLAPMVADQ